MYKLIISVATIFIVNSVFATANFEKVQFSNHIISNACSDDEPFVFYTEQVGNSKLLRVSFNGNEGNEGTLKIYDSNNILVIESNFELIKSPYFASVDVTNLSEGNYSLILTTATTSHTSQLVIQ